MVKVKVGNVVWRSDLHQNRTSKRRAVAPTTTPRWETGPYDTGSQSPLSSGGETVYEIVLSNSSGRWPCLRGASAVKTAPRALCRGSRTHVLDLEHVGMVHRGGAKLEFGLVSLPASH